MSSADERIQCSKCGRKVVPRLWHVRKRLSHMVTQHLCPFCGAVMYETGGEPRWGCIVAILLLIFILSLPAILVFINLALRHAGR